MDEPQEFDEMSQGDGQNGVAIQAPEDPMSCLPADLISAFNLNSRSPKSWRPDAADNALTCRDSCRNAGLTLLIDRELELLGIAASLYPATELEEVVDLLVAIETAVPTEEHSGVSKDGLYYYLLLGEKSCERDDADEFARSRYVSVAMMVQMRGYWQLDQGNMEEACALLSDPRHFYDEQVANLIILTMANTGEVDAYSAPVITSFIRSTKSPLLTNATRNVYLTALCIQDFPKAWRWVRGFEFEQDLRIQKAREWLAMEDDEAMLTGDAMDVEPENAIEKEFQEERKMTLEVVRERKRLLQGILRHIFSPSPRKGPLQQLLWLQIDPFEQSTLISYLTDPTSNLTPTSFDLLHDLITMRLLNNGQHALAIQLDRRVTELERALGKHIANPKARADRRQLVDGMIGVLPDVQRDILALERDMQQKSGNKSLKSSPDSSADITKPVSHAEEPTTSSVNGKHANGSASVLTPVRQPMSASASFRRATNPSNAIYEALLHSSSTIASPINGSGASPMARLRGDPAPGTSPRPQATYMQSPFNVPPRMPLGSPRRAASPYERQLTPSGSRQDSVEPRGRQAPSDRESDREATPVPARTRTKAKDEPAKRPSAEATKPTETRENLVPSPVEQNIPGAFPGSKPSQQAPMEPVESQPAERSRKRIPTARAREAAEQRALRRSTVGRSSKKEQEHADDMQVDEETGGESSQASTAMLSPPKKRKQHKTAPSDEETVPAPKAKRSKLPKPEAPPSPERNRRTRQSSVASSVASDTTEFGRGLRRSARHSHAPSPTRSEASETAGRRRQTTTSKQGSATPSRGGIRTRRQAAMSPQAEE